MRLWLYLTLVVNSIILLAFIGYGSHTASEQSAWLAQDLENDTRNVARSISAGSADYLLLASFDKIENLLLRQVTLGSVQELVVADRNGRILVQVERGSTGQPKSVYEHFLQPLDLSQSERGSNDQPRSVYEHVSQPLDLSQSEVRTLATYTLLLPIERGERLGWVRVTASLSALESVQREIWVDALLASLLTVVVTGGLLAVFLRKVTAALAHATQFAGDLIHQRGVAMPTISRIMEIVQLRRALNSAAQALRQSAKDMSDRQFALDQHAIVSITDLQGNITYANDLFCQISGYARDELLGQNHRLIKSGSHPPAFFEDLWQTISAGRVWHGEICNRNRYGALYWVSSTIVPLLGEDGQPEQYIEICTDITDRRQQQNEILRLNAGLEERVQQRTEELVSQQEELRQSNRYNRDLFNTSLIGLALCKMDGSLVDINQAYVDILGRSIEETIGLTYWEITPEEYSGQEQKQLESLRTLGFYGPYEKEYFHKDGHRVPVRLSGKLIEKDGTPHIWSVVEDITERRRAQDELQTQRNFATLVLDSIGQGLSVTRADGRFEFVNAAYAKLVGRTVAEIVGRTTEELAYPEDVDQQRIQRAHRRAGLTTTYEARVSRADGGFVHVSITGSPRYVNGEFVGSVAIVTDLTERNQQRDEILRLNASLEVRVQQRTEALRASEAQLRQITESMAEGVITMTTENIVLEANKAVLQLFGYEKSEFIGRDVSELVPERHRRQYKDTTAALAAQPEAFNIQGYEVRCVHKDGREFTTSMSFSDVHVGGQRLFTALVMDITELKRIDRMKTEFISTVSHELRTPLTSIRGALGLIAGGVAGELPEAVKNLVGIAKNNCERLIRLINDILDSEKIESGKMHLNLQVVDIKPLIQQALAANEGFAGQYRVTLLLRAPDEPLQVRIDSDRLTQVLTNLLSNAVKFSPPEGSVEVRVSRVAQCVQQERRALVRWTPVEVRVSRVAQQVRVEVADHGPGIPEEFRSRIFQKFSQADASNTRQKGGTGLGLNISKALIEKMGGQIGFSSEAGAGTTFFFELPEWKEPALLPPPLRVLAVASSRPCSKPRILHVEDDPDIQHIVAAIAADFANFEFAATLDEARARLLEQRFDLVLLDLALGQDSGWDLFEDIDTIDPRPPVIVFSASDVNPADGKQAEAVLLKTRTSNTELLHTIQRALQISGVPGLARHETRSDSPAAMTLTNPAFLASLEALRADYRRSLPQRLDQIESLWRQVQNDKAPAEALESLERCAHNLAGSGATCGFAALGDAARVLELAVHPLLGAAQALTPTAQSDVSRAIEALQRSLSGETVS